MNNYTAFLADSTDPRRYLQSAVNVGYGAAYTNGHIAVIAHMDVVEKNDAPETLHKVIGKVVDACLAVPEALWHPCPKIDEDAHRCKDCAGTGKNDICPECGGVGYVEFDNDYHSYEFDCRTCEAKSTHECQSCSGLGFGGKNLDALIFGTPVNPGYIKLIYDNLKSPMVAIGDDKVLLKFAGGVGALMKLRTASYGAPELMEKKP